MPQEPSPATAMISDRALNNLPCVEKPEIKILLYTDAPNDVVKEPSGDFGLGLMIALLEEHAPAFAKLCIKWVSRSSDINHHADHKLTRALLDDYDQIWLFGLHQVNRRSFYPGLNGGGPESELDADEVKELRAWMDKGGGVLITGDHANLRPTDALPPNPNPPCPYKFGNDEFAGLGRALGRCVPRAGELRDWDGPPTSREDDSLNTQFTLFTICGAQFSDQLLFQVDEKPQQLILPTFDKKGDLKPGGKPHPLFLYRDGCGPIQFFPDHLHEGQVVLPCSFPKTVWPENKETKIQPLPRVVAHGLDKRNGKKFDLLAAYDGSLTGVGRIVADSTWHHYFNINLAGFTRPTDPDCPVKTGPGSAIDQIGQFYGNLALWLSPAATRFRMTEAMFSWLAQHPRVSEELVPRPKALIDEKMRAGVVARRLLARVSSSCEIHELLNLAIAKYYSRVEPVETLHLPESGYNLGVLPSKELLLGSIINKYPRELLNNSEVSLANSKVRHEKIMAAFSDGAADAFEAHAAKVVECVGDAQKFLAEVRLRASNLDTEEKTRRELDAFGSGESAERSNDMSVCETAGWLMTLKKKGDGTETRFFFVGVKVTGETLEGRVFDSAGNETPLKGTCNPFGGTTVPPDLSLMSFELTTRGGGGGLVRIFISGYGFAVPGTSPGQAVFSGRYVAYAEPAGGVGDSRLTLSVDPGDTGTGNGQQT